MILIIPIFLITLGFRRYVTFMLVLYKVMLKKQNSGKPFNNCGAEVCCCHKEKK